MPVSEFVYLGGIDPGLATGGFVVVKYKVGNVNTNPPEVIWVTSLVEKQKERNEIKKQLHKYYDVRPGDRNYAYCDLRTTAQLKKFEEEFEAYLLKYPAPSAIAVESFIDQGSRSKQGFQKDRWKTPHVIGRLTCVLRNRGYNVEDGTLLFQDAGIAITQNKEKIIQLEQKGDAGIPGGNLLTNDHLRKAWAHAQTLATRWPIQ